MHPTPYMWILVLATAQYFAFHFNISRSLLQLDRNLSYLVEEKNEVDGEAHKQSQETQVVEVASQVVLNGKWMDYQQEPIHKLKTVCRRND